MARKGDQARAEVMEKILRTFEGSFVQDKKIYVTAAEGGETIQFAVSLTMPKIPVSGSAPSVNTSADGNHDWSDKPATATPVEISTEDNTKVEELMRRLNISD